MILAATREAARAARAQPVAQMLRFDNPPHSEGCALELTGEGATGRLGYWGCVQAPIK